MRHARCRWEDGTDSRVSAAYLSGRMKKSWREESPKDVRRMIRILILGLVVGAVLFLVLIKQGRGIGGGIDGTQIRSVSWIPLTERQKEDLRRLGLTPRNVIEIGNDRKQTIHGRFLHITDLHPDPYYKTGTDKDKQCHSGRGDSSKYGDALGGCDSPKILVEDTIKWAAENFKDKIDFIVWTGDNVRHDNDRMYPRTEDAIFDQNEEMTELIFDQFKSKDLGEVPVLKFPIIPSLGNNDVYPHNMCALGPTLFTRKFFNIWERLIPHSQMHTFVRGAFFFQEIIPDHLAVLSINTLYLFSSNPLVDNCDRRKQPGYKFFQWLGYVLKELRSRNMKVWVVGHVPPNNKNFEWTCLRKFTAWMHEYRDIIIGNLYGHMNLDHFFPLDSVEAYKSIEEDYGKFGFRYGLPDEWEAEQMNERKDSNIENFFGPRRGPPNKVAFMESVRHAYAGMKKGRKGGIESERYIIAHVGTSVVPTFNPGMRVWEYNITELPELIQSKASLSSNWSHFFKQVEKTLEEETDDDYNDTFSLERNAEIFKKDKTFPPAKPIQAPLGPAYVKQTFTPQRYVQYYANLTSINEGSRAFLYDIEYSTDNAVLQMKSLITKEWVTFARKLGKSIRNKRRSTAAKGENEEKRKLHKTQQKKDTIQMDTGNPFLKSANLKWEKLWTNYTKYVFVSTNYENS